MICIFIKENYTPATAPESVFETSFCICVFVKAEHYTSIPSSAPDSIFKTSISLVWAAYLYLHLSKHQHGQHYPVHNIPSSRHPSVFVYLYEQSIKHQHQPVHQIPSSKHPSVFMYLYKQSITHQHHPVHQIPSSRHPSVLSRLCIYICICLNISVLV